MYFFCKIKFKNEDKFFSITLLILSFCKDVIDYNGLKNLAKKK